MAGGKKWEGKEKGGKEERREEGHTRDPQWRTHSEGQGCCMTHVLVVRDASCG